MNPADHAYRYGTTHPELMEVNTILEVLNQVGIPVAISVILMWFIKYQFDESRAEREVLELQRDFNKSIIDSISKLSTVIENNTRVVESSFKAR